MLTWFLGWLERRGKKYVILDAKIGIVFERWYVLGSRGKGWKVMLHKWMPAAKVHSRHNHSARCWSLILRGGYDEQVNDGPVRTRRMLSFGSLKQTDYHSAKNILPGTWTVFVEGNPSGDYKSEAIGGRVSSFPGVQVVPGWQRKMALWMRISAKQGVDRV